MGRLLKVVLWSLPIGIVGSFIGMASGAIGVCGNGGWGLVPAFIGLGALLVFSVSFSAWLFLTIWNKLTA